METIIRWATIIGGLAAIGYFLEKFFSLCEQWSCFKWAMVLAGLIFIILMLYYFWKKFGGKRGEMEQSEGPVGLGSPFYIERPPIESDSYHTIMQPSALIRITAPRQMGKTSLLMRIVEQAQRADYRTVSLSFDQIENAKLVSLASFLPWFCRKVTHNLNLPVEKVAQLWNKDLDGMSNCSRYFEKALLMEDVPPLVLALDKVDRLFVHQEIAGDFFRLLRSWHEKKEAPWSMLRLILIYSGAVPISFKIHHSPFNVGTLIELPEFDEAQVRTLAQRYQLNWTEMQIQTLMAMVGGHPHLIRLAFEKITRQQLSLEELLRDAPTDRGLYRHHLRCLLDDLQQGEIGFDLVAIMRQVVTSNEPIKIESQVESKLYNLGLIKLVQNDAVIPRCDLYQRYFINHL